MQTQVVMKWTLAILFGLALIVVGFRFWYPLLTIFFIFNCLVLIIVVLLQSGKAADLAGAFGGAGSQTAFGPRGAASVLSKVTTWCAVMFMVCSLAMVLHTDKNVATGSSVLQDVSKTSSKPASTTPAPAQQPASAPASQTPAPATQQPASQPPKN